MTTTPGAGLGAMIRTWRDRLPPSAAALPVARRARRAAGLRHRLAHLVPPSHDTISDHIPPGVHRVLTRLGDVAVAVFAADWQLVWWNRGWAALLGDPSSSPPQLRNFARDRFPIDTSPARLALWPVTEVDIDATDAAVVSDLRRATGRFPHDTRLAELIRVLSTGNQRFAELWATGTVATHREDHKTIEHPSVGPITVDCDVLADGDSELKIVIMTAVPGSADETKLRLAGIAGHYQQLAHPPLDETTGSHLPRK